MTMVAEWQRGRSFETDTPEVLEMTHMDIPVQSVESEIGTANYFIGQAVSHLVRAAEILDPVTEKNPLDDLIWELDDDFREKLGNVIKKLEEGA